MLNINFVPEEYIKNSKSFRTNLIYLAMLAVVMLGLGGSFAITKIRQRGLAAKEKVLNAKMAEAQESIKKFEQLQQDRSKMMKAALTTTELLEPVPRSVLLASVTNSLPMGVSLSKLKLVQRQPQGQRNSNSSASKYARVQAEKTKTQSKSAEKLLETSIDIEGFAASDIQVAAYIQKLGECELLDNVSLVESSSNSVKSQTDSSLRHFKLTAMLGTDVQITASSVERIARR